MVCGTVQLATTFFATSIMKVQSYKTIMLLSVCSWGVTGAIAFWAGNRFGPNGTLIANATKGGNGKNQDALQKALEKALTSHSASAKDPGAPTVDQLMSLKGKVDPALVARWAASLSPADCAKEMADLQKMPAGTKRDAMLSALYDSWAKQDPQGFLVSSGKMTNPVARQASTTKALTAWATQDPKAALAWLDKNPGATGALQTQQYNAVIAGFAANNPSDAYNYVMGLPDGATPGSPQAQAKIDAMRAVISGMADKGNFADIVTLVGQMPGNSAIQTQAYRELVSQWVANSPTDAAQWITSLDPTQFPQARQYSNQLVQSWAQTDPLAAAAWAAQQDAARLAANGQGGARGGGGRGGNLLATAVGQMVAVGDMDQAGTYLNTLQAGPEKDSAVSAFVTGAANEDPAGAMKWVQQGITNPNTQSRMTSIVAMTWSQQDPAGFNDYLNSMDPNSAQQLRQTVQQMQQNQFGGGFGGNGGGGGRNGGGNNGGGGRNGGGNFQQGGVINGGGAAAGNAPAASGPQVINSNGNTGRRGGRGGRAGGA